MGPETLLAVGLVCGLVIGALIGVVVAKPAGHHRN
ncbi:hypothetical protein N182_18445 [Sinorhizobium sp. GL2]|nr:hypothetical protein N182_18445 [Sinorhizobium sp. GL2]